ncbi:MAG: hypothetical protein AVDCRST_MAG05-2055, partial [uncultured Rubrobacteraceae bacterium]
DGALADDPRRRRGQRGDKGLGPGSRRRKRAPAAGDRRDLASSPRPAGSPRRHRDLRRRRDARPGREGPRRRCCGGRPPAAGAGARRRLSRRPHRRAGEGVLL